MAVEAKRWCAAISFLLLLLTPEPGVAQKYSEWTGWTATDDPLVLWRTRTQDWGKNMSPVCYVEFAIVGEGAANFRYGLTFRAEGLGSSTTGHKAGAAYGVKRDDAHGAEQVLGCRQVSGVTITRVVRRTGGTEPATRPRLDAESGSTAAPPHAAERPERAVPQQIPDVIHFPGSPKPFRGPELRGIGMDSRSLQRIHAASNRLGQRLHGWRPFRLWARGQAAAIGQSDWKALAALVAHVDKRVLRDLAADASRFANESGNTREKNLRPFWQAMADFYRYQAAP